MTEPERPLDAADLWALRRVGAPIATRDGRVILTTVKTYDVQADRGHDVIVRVGEEGVVALTADDVSSSSPTVSPDGRRLAFVRTPRAGGERPGATSGQLHVMSLDGGEARCVTDLPLGVSDPRFLPDGRRVVVVAGVLEEAIDKPAPADKGGVVEATRALLEARAKSRVRAHVTESRVYRFWDHWLTDGAVPHLFLVDLDSGSVRDLTPTSRRWFDLMEDPGQYDVSPDGRHVVFAANRSAPPHRETRWSIFEVAVDGDGEVRELTPDVPADASLPRYSPDGRSVLFGQRRDDYYGDRIRLRLLDRATLETEVLAEDWDRSPSEWCFRDDGSIVGCVEEEARGAVFELRRGEAPRILCREGTAHGLVVAGARLLVQHATLSRPPEIAEVVDGAPKLLTHVNDPILSRRSLAAVEDVRFTGANGDPVQMWVLYPPGFDATKKYPLVHLIHGGPYGTFGDVFHFRWSAQVIAGLGYVVALVNFHGSSSFGEAFSRSILADWGGKPKDDILLATDHLLARGFVDPARMAIAGGSYGGYLTAWLATQTSRFRCAIAHAAVYNLGTLWASDVTQGTDLEFGGMPWGSGADLARIDAHDPARHSAGYATPMLVIHGDLDYRVPVSHGLELYGVLVAKGVEARLVHYPDENHWILKPQNSLHWYGEFTGWLRRWLG